MKRVRVYEGERFGFLENKINIYKSHLFFQLSLTHSHVMILIRLKIKKCNVLNHLNYAPKMVTIW